MEIVTARLLLREWRDSDFAAVREYETQPHVHLYEPPVPTEAQTWEFLRQAQDQARVVPRTHYQFALTVRSHGGVRGRIKLILLTPGIREWEIGWTVHEQDWGRGYATEAAQQVMAHAFRQLGAHRVVAFCHIANTASERVMQKLGMRQEAHFRSTLWWQGGWSDELLYAILDCDYQDHFCAGGPQR